MKTLNDVFSSWLTQGIFSFISSKSPPWISEISASDLDLEYHGNVSGNKYISPLVDALLDDNEELPLVNMNKLADVIMSINGKRWSHLWSTLSYEYNPIENYSMTEVMTDDESVTEYGKTTTTTNNLSHTKTGTDTQTPNLTDTANNSVYGFNQSSIATPTGEQTNTQTGTNTTQYNTVDADTGTQGNAETGSDTTTRNYTLTRFGNIGVTTSQQMIESERALWMWDFFRNVVFPDIDKTLTINIY